LVRLTGKSGEPAREELELGQRVWLRLEEGVAGEDAVEVPEAPDESRECIGAKGVVVAVVVVAAMESSCCREV